MIKSLIRHKVHDLEVDVQTQKAATLEPAVLMKVETAWGAGARLTPRAGVEALLFEQGAGEDSGAKQE